MKNQKGITLVALVVTIVVLLILAATSIAMLRGDSGIITNAQKAKYANVESEAMEKIKMAYNGVVTTIKVGEATTTGYTATSHVAEYADEIYEDLIGKADETIVNSAGTAVGDATSNTTGYNVSYSGSTITVTYTDADFNVKDTNGAKYNKISYTVTITNNAAELSEYTPQAK